MFTPFQSASYEPLNIETLEGNNSRQNIENPGNPSKRRNNKTRNLDQPAPSKKYDTFSPEAKKDLPRKVKNLCRVFGYIKNKGNFAGKFGFLKPNARSRILKKIIPQYKPQFNLKDKNQLREMWKKVKRILESCDKSEKRGNPVLYHAELPDFRIKIIKIIKSLSSKNFSVLREKVLGVIKDLRADNKRKMEDNVFGKHYWSVFKKDPENSEIKDLWLALPRSNAAKKGRAPKRVASLSSDDCQSTMPSTPNTLMLPVFPENSPSPSQNEEFMSFLEGHDVIIGFDHSHLQFENPDYHHYQQNHQFSEETDDNNVLLFREIIEDEDAYEKRVFGGLGDGTFPWNF